jgi:hypothetical protein
MAASGLFGTSVPGAKHFAPSYPIVRGEDYVRTATQSNYVIRMDRVTRGRSFSVIFVESGFLPRPSPCKTRWVVVKLGAIIDSTSYPPVKSLLPRRPSRFPSSNRASASGCLRFVNEFTTGRSWDTGTWGLSNKPGRRDRRPIVPGTVLPVTGNRAGGSATARAFSCVRPLP